MARICEFEWAEGVVDLTNNARYRLAFGWSPAVAERRGGLIGGRSQINEVQERVPFQIRGESVEEVAVGMRDLTAMMEAAARYEENEEGEPVRWRFLPDYSSTIAPWEVMVVRPVRGGVVFNSQTLLAMEKVGSSIVIEGELQFVRRGLWQGLEEAVSSIAGSSQANSDNIITFPAFSGGYSALPASMKLEWEVVASPSIIYELMMVIAPPNYLALYVASDIGTPVAQAGAIGGEVIAISSGGSAQCALTALGASVPLVHVYLKIKNVSGSDAVVTITTSLGQVRVVASDDSTHIYYGGLERNETARSVIVAATGGDISIDSILIVAASDEAFVLNAAGQLDTLGTLDMVIDPRTVTGVTPLMQNENETECTVDITGDGYIEIRGTTVEAFLYGCRPWPSNLLHYVTGGVARPFVELVVTRRVGAMVPV